MFSHIIKLNIDEGCCKKINGICYFLALIGDYRIMIITLGNFTVTMCSSMDPKSLALCIFWKYSENTKVLCNDKNQFVRDTCGSLDLNNWDRKNATCKALFLTTVSKLCTTQYKSGECCSPCKGFTTLILQNIIKKGLCFT